MATSIVTGKIADANLPPRIRDLLSAESGANDGLALPFVAAGLTLLGAHGHTGWSLWFWRSVLVEVGGALIFGALVGFIAGRLLDWAVRTREIERTSYIAYTLTLTAVAFGGASLLHVNEVLAVFVTGLSFDHAVVNRSRKEEQEVQEALERFFVLPVFVLLGIALPWDEWASLGPSALVLALAVRRRRALLRALRKETEW